MIPDTNDMGSIQVGGQRITLKLVRSRRRKRTIAFAIEPPATLRITAPMRADVKTLRHMVENRMGWITQRLAGIRARNNSSAPTEFIDGKNISYLGHDYRLSVTHDEDRPQGCLVRPRRIIVNIHDDKLCGEDLQQEVRLEILLGLKKRAREKIQKRADFWAEKMGVCYKRLSLSNPQRRWGSCSAQNIIRINWRLIIAPLSVLDYVIVHELCHVAHKNHGKKFWQEVESVMPDYQQRRKELRQTGHYFAL